MVDHTLLRPEATSDEVAALCAEAVELRVWSVCVAPTFLPLATGLLGEGVVTCTVVGFPSGTHQPRIKAAEAELAVGAGAAEVDMVVDIGAVKAGSWRRTAREVRDVRDASGGALLKVILETAVLSDDEIVRAAITCQEAGADYVKTSTGQHPAGGATTHAVSLLAGTVGGRLGVKASGGIRSTEAALAMIGAGATRLGLSGTRAVLAGLPDGDEEQDGTVAADRWPALSPDVATGRPVWWQPPAPRSRA